jgi:hypothetical protein
MYILGIHAQYGGEETMRTARVFKSGNSQAVRLPREFKLDAALVTNNTREFERVPDLKIENWEAMGSE